MTRSGFILTLLVGGSLFAATPGPTPDPAPDSEGDVVLYRFLDANKSNRISGLQMEVDVNASLPKMQKRGKLQALRTITKLGRITWDRLNFTGDNTIRKEVIARYIQAEQESQDTGKFSLTPDHYKFKYKGLETKNGVELHIFQVTPKKKQVGYFKGEIWVDPQTYLPVREAGQLVKNPSMFLKKVQFVREYEIRDGLAYPKHVESNVETRFWGPAQMSIEYGNYAKTDELQSDLTPTPDRIEAQKIEQ